MTGDRDRVALRFALWMFAYGVAVGGCVAYTIWGNK